MRTIEELEKEIDSTNVVLATMPDTAAFANARKVLKNNVEKFQKRITEIRANVVKLGDGKPATIGSTVFGYKMPETDEKTGAIIVDVFKRTVAMTKKDADGNGVLYFGTPTAKYERLPKYEAARFFSTELGAKGDMLLRLKLGVEEAAKELENQKALVAFIEKEKVNVRDLTKSQTPEAAP